VLAAVAVGVLGCLIALGFLFWPHECSLERGEALMRQGKYADAVPCFEEVIARDPSASRKAFDDRAHACKLNGDGNPDEAVKRYDEACRLEKGRRYGEAVEQYREAIRLDFSFFWAPNNLAYLLAVCPDGAVRDPTEAVRLAEDACQRSGWKCWETLDTLAVALAARKEFDEAARRAEQAMRLAPAAEQALLRQKLDHFRRDEPWESGRSP
jgi:tetratricopeptide (TPR) repeat protein